MTEPLVEIKNLRTHFFTDEGVVKAVEDVSLTIPRGKTLGLVGESGCGKSVTALSIIRLISPPGKIVSGSIAFYDDGRKIELTTLPEAEMRKMRGSRIAMIFQEPMTSLNPVFTVGSQIAEAVRLHHRVSSREAWDRAVEMLHKVRIPDAQRRASEYPHHFSGGMRQRVMIAMALSCNPKLLIADEPSTALDVTIQAQVLDLLRDLQTEFGMSILIITHDLGVIAEMADDVCVMYASKVVEYAPVVELFTNPLHPYTRGLFASRPEPGKPKDQKLRTIPGVVPSPLRFPSGCKFHPRCAYAQERCKKEEPVLRRPNLSQIPPSHVVHCHFAEQIEEQEEAAVKSV
ncbi:MAG: ABC transporter ATP-binding protein [Planctomycetia bacterium]|nr:ABC transporter ATP-binding protein [Planctomycetia bacterium]